MGALGLCNLGYEITKHPSYLYLTLVQQPIKSLSPYIPEPKTIKCWSLTLSYA